MIVDTDLAYMSNGRVREAAEELEGWCAREERRTTRNCIPSSGIQSDKADRTEDTASSSHRNPYLHRVAASQNIHRSRVVARKTAIALVKAEGEDGRLLRCEVGTTKTGRAVEREVAGEGEEDLGGGKCWRRIERGVRNLRPGNARLTVVASCKRRQR